MCSIPEELLQDPSKEYCWVTFLGRIVKKDGETISQRKVGKTKLTIQIAFKDCILQAVQCLLRSASNMTKQGDKAYWEYSVT